MGAEIVRYCVSIGRPVRACTRSGVFDAAAVLGDDTLAAATVPWSSPLLTYATADVTGPDDKLAAAVAGAGMVIFAATAPANGVPEEVDHLGLVKTAEACIAANVPRLVIVSGAGVTKTQSQAYWFLNMFGGRMDAKVAGEDAVRAMYHHRNQKNRNNRADAAAAATREGEGEGEGDDDGVVDDDCSYVVVRPSGLLDGAAKGPGALAVNQGDEAAGFINRADVAACCVEAGDAANTRGVTFEVYDAGTAVATATLSIADILSDPKLAAIVSLVTGQTWRRWWMKRVSRTTRDGESHQEEGDGIYVNFTARERRGVDYPSLFDSLRPDDDEYDV